MNASPITIYWSLCLALLGAMTLCVRAQESYPPVPGSHATGHTIQKSERSSHTVVQSDNASHSAQQEFEKSLQNAQEQMRKYREEILSQRGKDAGPNPNQPLGGQETILERMARLDEMIRQMQESMKNAAPSAGASQDASKDQTPGGIKGTISKGMGGGGAAQGQSLSGDTSSQISIVSFNSEPKIKDLGNAYEIRIEAKGLNTTNLKVDIEGKMMTIKGSSEEQTETKDSNGVISTTRSSTSYRRSFSLPGPVDTAKIKTEYKDGTLIITAPKKKS